MTLYKLSKGYKSYFSPINKSCDDTLMFNRAGMTTFKSFLYFLEFFTKGELSDKVKTLQYVSFY